MALGWEALPGLRGLLMLRMEACVAPRTHPGNVGSRGNPPWRPPDWPPDFATLSREGGGELTERKMMPLRQGPWFWLQFQLEQSLLFWGTYFLHLQGRF